LRRSIHLQPKPSTGSGLYRRRIRLSQHHPGVDSVGSNLRISFVWNTTGNQKHFLNAKSHDVILPGPFLTEDALKQAIASLEARAEEAERNCLPKTAKSWRDAIENLQKPPCVY
jgi:hypothetical protein